MRELFIGLDIGTTNVKGLLVNTDGKILRRASRPLKLHSPRPGWNEQDPNAWWRAATEVLRELSSDVDGKIVSISSSGQMHSLVAIDKDGEVLRDAILWNDQRSYQECDEITEILGGEENLLKTFGNPMYPGFTLPKILWVKKNEPRVFERIEKVMLPKDYINYRLTGRVFTEFSDASGTVALDVRKKNWASEMLKELGIPVEIFPEILRSHDVVGRITDEVAGETGLPKGTLVVAGGADNACSALGIGVVSSKEVMISLGTSGTVFSPTEGTSPDPKGRVHFFHHVVPETFYHMGVMLSATFSLDWFKSRFLVEDYEEINERVREVPPGSNGVVFLPYLNGERTPHRDPFARGCFVGLAASNSKWDVVRSIFEGVAFGIKDSFEILEELGIEAQHVRITGGGAKSEVWRRIVADVIGKPLERAVTEEGGSYGAAALAYSGYSSTPPEETARRWVEVKRDVEPGEDFEVYQDVHRKYKLIYEALRDVFRLS